MSECANEYRRQCDELFQALKDALKVIDGICNEECSDYGFGDEIDRLRMISENKKPCRFCDHPEGSRHSRPYCTKHQTFCEPGYYPDCEKETTLYPHHEKETEMNTPKNRNCDRFGDVPGDAVSDFLKKHPNANFSGTDQHAISVFAGWAFSAADKEDPSCR